MDVATLPDDVREKLAELELELSEGDITQKGYEKKRQRLLAPYLNVTAATTNNNNGTASGQGQDTHNYVNSSVTANSNNNSQCGHGQSSSGSRHSNDKQHNYVNQPPLVAHHHHHHHHPKEGSSAHSKHRRNGQKRVTHNEKRYHSGSGSDLVLKQK